MRIAFALALGTLLLAGQAFAITTCGREVLNGNYGFQIAGTSGRQGRPRSGLRLDVLLMDRSK